MRRALVVAVLAGPACNSDRDAAREEHSTPSSDQKRPELPEAIDEAADETGDPLAGEDAHEIPFADRTSMGYLLLLPATREPPTAPTRDELATWVRHAFPDRRGGGEIDLLLTLIATEPHTTELGFDLEPPKLVDPGELESDSTTSAVGRVVDPVGSDELAEQMALRERERSFDLLGLHIERIRLGVGDDVIPAAAMIDPVLTRGLDSIERDGLPGRGWALLLRADYRNQHGVRGLRLLQTLARVVAEREHALIHDPDTLETMNLAAFEARRLRANAGNVADQLAIVPFEDRRHPGMLRMSTRGMRRFGSVDLELDGLPADERVLQRASDLLAGLALIMVQEGEVDVSGFAVQVADELEVDFDAVVRSYGDRGGSIQACAGCPGRAVVHLVERASEEHDPGDHVVARVVAPRATSDSADYDQASWALGVLAELFGPAAIAAP